MSMLGDMDSASKALSNPEVLVCIIKHLSARDILNFKGVCKLWKENCDLNFVLRQYIAHQCEDIYTYGHKVSGYRRLNLEFQDCDLRFISWKISNPKLRCLRIFDCITEIESLQCIISKCVGLETLEIVLKRRINPDLLEQLLDYFIERGERHARLRRLSINGQRFMTIMSHFLKLLTVFPYIVYLSCDVGKADDDGRYSCTKNYGTYDLRKLKSYTMVSENDDHWLERPVAPMLDYQLFRLTTYKTIFEFTTLFADVQRRERLFNFFTIQKDLEIIDFQIYGISDKNFGESIKSLMFHVLRTCSKLREFYIRDYHARDPRMIARFGFLKLTSKEFKEFFSLISSLQCFKLTYRLKVDTSKTTVLPLSVPKTSLSVLRLNTRESYIFSGLKLSSNLKHLNVDIYTDQQLREIIVTLPNLEILILRLRGCTNYGFIGRNEESSIRRLRKLEYLFIFDSKGRITNEVFNEFRFPRLDYLGLRLKHENQIIREIPYSFSKILAYFDCFSRTSTIAFMSNPVYNTAKANESYLLPETLIQVSSIRTLEISFMKRNPHLMPEFITKLCKPLGNLEHLIVSEKNLLPGQKILKSFKNNLLSKWKWSTYYYKNEDASFRNEDASFRNEVTSSDRPSRNASLIGTGECEFWDDKVYSWWDRTNNY